MLDKLLTNWPLKLLALVMAFATWVSTTGEREALRDFTIALEILQAQDQTLSSSAPTSITVRLIGRESSIRRLDPLRLGATVDLRDSGVGPLEIQLTTANLTGVPGGVDLDFINPDRLSLVVDKLLRVQLPVEPTFSGKPPDGYTFYGATVRPMRLTIEGPTAAIEALSSLSTNPIRLNDLTQPETMQATTIIENQMIRIVDPRQLDVRVIVDTNPEERRYENIPVELTGQQHEATPTPALVGVTLSGPPALLERISADALRTVADISDLAPQRESYRVPLQLDYSGISLEDRTRIRLKTLDHEAVRVRVEERKITE